MAENLRGVNKYPHFANISVDTNTKEIQLPPSTRLFTVGSEDKKIYVAQNGATDNGSLPANYAFVPAGNMMQLRIGVGLENPSSIFIACSTGTGTAHIIIEE
jgi:hypothetical protein